MLSAPRNGALRDELYNGQIQYESKPSYSVCILTEFHGDVSFERLNHEIALEIYPNNLLCTISSVISILSLQEWIVINCCAFFTIFNILIVLSIRIIFSICNAFSISNENTITGKRKLQTGRDHDLFRLTWWRHIAANGDVINDCLARPGVCRGVKRRHEVGVLLSEQK